MNDPHGNAGDPLVIEIRLHVDDTVSRNVARYTRRMMVDLLTTGNTVEYVGPERDPAMEATARSRVHNAARRAGVAVRTWVTRRDDRYWVAAAVRDCGCDCH